MRKGSCTQGHADSTDAMQWMPCRQYRCLAEQGFRPKNGVNMCVGQAKKQGMQTGPCRRGHAEGAMQMGPCRWGTAAGAMQMGPCRWSTKMDREDATEQVWQANAVACWYATTCHVEMSHHTCTIQAKLNGRDDCSTLRS